MTADIQSLRSSTLLSISDATRSLSQALRTIKQDAERALEAIEQGQRVSGMTLGAGPIDGQATTEVVKLTSRLDTLIRQAYALGCDEQSILAAYTGAE